MLRATEEALQGGKRNLTLGEMCTTVMEKAGYNQRRVFDEVLGEVLRLYDCICDSPPVPRAPAAPMSLHLERRVAPALHPGLGAFGALGIPLTQTSGPYAHAFGIPAEEEIPPAPAPFSFGSQEERRASAIGPFGIPLARTSGPYEHAFGIPAEEETPRAPAPFSFGSQPPRLRGRSKSLSRRMRETEESERSSPKRKRQPLLLTYY